MTVVARAVAAPFAPPVMAPRCYTVCRCGHGLSAHDSGADNLDEVERLVRQGKLVPFGTLRDSFIAGIQPGSPPQPGDILPERYMVMSVELAPGEEGWNLKVKRLVPPRAMQR